MSDHHVRWSSFIGEHRYVDHIYYMIHARPFGLQCSEAMSVHARLIMFKSSIRMYKTVLHPLYVNVEPITPNHHVVSQHEELSQRRILRENTS